MSLAAIHIRTGEVGLNRSVEAWLARHNVPAQNFSDAYEACVYLIGHAPAVPDFAFIGADWLTPEEWPIVRFLREVWPALAIIVYAGRRVPGLPEPAALRSVCTSPRMLDLMLELGPDNLLRSVRSSVVEDLTPTAPLGNAPCQQVSVYSTGDGSEAAGDHSAGDPVQSAALAADVPRTVIKGERPRPAKLEELWLLSGQED